MPCSDMYDRLPGGNNMTTRNTVAHSLHDLGLAAWFGGSLMGAIGLNGAAADVRDPYERTKVAQAGWGRWTPVNLAAIGAHLAGGAALTVGNRHRIVGQKGVLVTSAVKTGLTVGALGVTAYSRVLGEHVMRAGDVPSSGGTEPTAGTPQEVATAQRRLKALQWVIPALTGALIVTSAYMSEQQHGREEIKGLVGRGTKQLGKTLAAGAVAGKLTGKVFATKKKTGLAAKAIKHAPKAVAKTEAARWATKTAPTATRKAAKNVAKAKLVKAIA